MNLKIPQSLKLLLKAVACENEITKQKFLLK